MTDKQRLILMILFAFWVIVFAYSFYAYATTAPTGDSFVRGANRIMAYLGWQGIAGMIGLAIFAVGRAWPKRSSVRALAWVPIGLALAQVTLIVGVIAWARFAK